MKTSWSRSQGVPGLIFRSCFKILLFTQTFKRYLGAKSQGYSRLDLPAAPQSAHRLLCGCFTSSSKIFLFHSWVAISTESRRPLSQDGPRRRHWAWCCNRLNPGRDETGTMEEGDFPPRRQKQVPAQIYAQLRSRARSVLRPVSRRVPNMRVLIYQVDILFQSTFFFPPPFVSFKIASKIHLTTRIAWVPFRLFCKTSRESHYLVSSHRHEFGFDNPLFQIVMNAASEK